MRTAIDYGDDVPVIAFDESGSEAENLIEAAHPILSIGSVHLSVDKAAAFLDAIRAARGSSAPEIKASAALHRRVRPTLLTELEGIQDACNVYLVDKAQFLAAKIIDTLVAEHAREHRFDLAGTGEAKLLADALTNLAPTAIGESSWRNLLFQFNHLARSYKRAGTVPPSADRFLFALNGAVVSSAGTTVAGIFDAIWEARSYAASFREADPGQIRDLDPMVPGLMANTATWAMRLNGQPFRILSDEYWGFDGSTRDVITAHVAVPLSVGGRAFPRVRLLSFDVADSRSDVRIQVADVIAGVGREVARLAYNGTFDDDLQAVCAPMLDFNPLVAAGTPIDVLFDQAPPTYFTTWLANQ